MEKEEERDIEGLRARWTSLYRARLPALAKSHDPAQKSWPVHLDHCFARIVLDNAVGIDRPWTEVVKAPAVKHMSAQQLEVAIRMAEGIVSGEVDLVEMDGRSLGLRGKMGKGVKRKGGSADGVGDGETKRQRKGEDGTISRYFLPSPTSPQKVESAKAEDDTDAGDEKSPRSSTTEGDQPNMAPQLHRIATSTLTPFRKHMLTLLCQIPRGRYSTYQALSDHVTAISHKTCARAVGSAMRNNPFAPEVPCHRVVANDGSIGGFNGFWGEEGKFAGEKRRLLGEEGVLGAKPRGCTTVVSRTVAGSSKVTIIAEQFSTRLGFFSRRTNDLLASYDGRPFYGSLLAEAILRWYI
ncbi:uncharacterized protein LTR77_008418 [Saxophila tyrrhenica]|uniref:Methylated-DNA--protein-cysteine methyltransferase n=1 Tax=Saxophila tyrrhenica TaxID=1690608 RepID=A0AAV9P468_9PEZI|nr:hypothetical protein LTR77_008418 [Saxophila tyrrhenica]